MHARLSDHCGMHHCVTRRVCSPAQIWVQSCVSALCCSPLPLCSFVVSSSCADRELNGRIRTATRTLDMAEQRAEGRGRREGAQPHTQQQQRRLREGKEGGEGDDEIIDEAERREDRHTHELDHCSRAACKEPPPAQKNEQQWRHVHSAHRTKWPHNSRL